MKKSTIALILVLLMLAMTPSGASGAVRFSESQDESEASAEGGQWVWVRDVEIYFYVNPLGVLSQSPLTSWYATNEDGEPDPYGAWSLYRDGLSTDPSEPPEVVEVVYIPYRKGDIGGHHGIELEPIGHWEWQPW